MATNYSQDQLKDYWLSEAAKLERRIKIAAALDVFLPLFFWLSLPLAAAIIWCRTTDLPLWWWAPALGIVTLTAAPIAAWRAWHHPFDLKQALIRLEHRLYLNSALSSAHEGATPWPAPFKTQNATPTWRWSRLSNEPALTLMLLLLAFLIPLPSPTNANFVDREPPPALKTVNQWLDQLEESNTIEPEPLEELRQQVRDILRRPDSQWYEHASLEAADNIRTSTQTAIAELNDALQLAASAIEGAATLSSLSPTQLQELQDALDRAYDSLKSGALPLNSNLRQSLQGLQLNQLQNLPPEQLQELLENLKQQQQTCQNTGACSGSGQGEGDGSGNGSGEGEGNGQGNSDTVLLVDNTTGAQPGTGGINRGGGPAPLAYNIQPTELNTANIEALPPADLSRALLSDLTQLTSRAPTVAPQDTTAPGGTARTESRGQSASYREEFSPQERAVLENYFQ